MIYWKYLKTWFVVDVVSILPFDVIALYETEKVHREIAAGWDTASASKHTELLDQLSGIRCGEGVMG